MNTNDFIDFATENFNEKYVSEVQMSGLHPTVVNYIRHTAGVLRAPTNFIYGEVLTILGAMLGKKMTVIDGDYRNRGNLFSAIVGGASSAKSPSINYTMKPVIKNEKTNYDDYQRSVHAAQDKDEDLPPYDKQLVASNETIENLYRVLFNVKNYPNGLLMHQDELLNFFGGNAKKYSDGNIISDFLTLFDGFTPLRVGRVRMEIPLYVPEPFIAILGGIQKKRVDELFAGQEHNGWFTRWLFWLANKESQFIDDGNTSYKQDWNDILERATSPDISDLNLHFQDIKVVRAYDDEYRDLRNKFEDDGEDDLAEAIMKEGYYIRRLSGIIHCLNALAEGYRPSETIKTETVEYAAQVIEHLFQNTCIVQRIIESKRKKKISGREAILALDEEYGIANQSMLSAALGGSPNQKYISRILSEAKKKK